MFLCSDTRVIFSYFACHACQPPSLTLSLFFFFNDTAPTEIYTLSLHDALPISNDPRRWRGEPNDHLVVHTDLAKELVIEPKRSEEHTSELQSHSDLVCRLLLEKKKKNTNKKTTTNKSTQTARTRHTTYKRTTRT